MRAAVLHRFGDPLGLEEYPAPHRQGEEVVVRVRGAGVCHTDVHLIEVLTQSSRFLGCSATRSRGRHRDWASSQFSI